MEQPYGVTAISGTRRKAVQRRRLPIEGQSILDVVKSMEAASNRPVPYVLAGRRSRQAAIMPSQSRACKPGMTSPAQSRGLSEVQRKRVLLIQAKDGELLRDGITPPLWDWAQDNVLAT